WTVLIQESTTAQSEVRIHGKGTHIHKTLGLTKVEKAIQEITRSKRRVHKCTCERLFHSSCQMVNNRGPRRRFPAIRGRKKIAGNDFHFLLGIELAERFSESSKLAGGPDKPTD